MSLAFANPVAKDMEDEQCPVLNTSYSFSSGLEKFVYFL
jgi:hypothetical protein